MINLTLAITVSGWVAGLIKIPGINQIFDIVLPLAFTLLKIIRGICHTNYSIEDMQLL